MGDGHHHHHAVLAGIQSSNGSGGPFLQAAQGKLAKSFQAKASSHEWANRAASIVIGGAVSKASLLVLTIGGGSTEIPGSFPGSADSDVFCFLLFLNIAPDSDFLSYRLALGVGQKYGLARQ